MYKAREQEYLVTISKYASDGNDARLLSIMMGKLACYINMDIKDYLGKLYMDTIPQTKLGQFFTPFHISYLTCKTSVSDEELVKEIEDKGKITLYEPSCGSGGMILAFCKRLKELGYDPSEILEVYACDLDINSVYMTFIQLSMLNINAQIIRGDSLSMNKNVSSKDVFITPLKIGKKVLHA